MKPIVNFDALFTAMALTLVVSLAMSINRLSFLGASPALADTPTAIAAVSQALRTAILGPSNSQS
jgi:hypothetical protein